MRYQTSATGFDKPVPEGWHPCNAPRFGSDDAQRFVPLITIGVETFAGQAVGEGTVIAIAFEQLSLAGAAPPLQAVAQVPGQFTQEIVAAQPAAVIVLSLLNLIVKHPLFAVTTPGLVVPKYQPIRGLLVFGPL